MKIDGIFADAAFVVVGLHADFMPWHDNFAKEIGASCFSAYVIFMEALRPFALEFFNHNKTSGHKYEFDHRHLMLNGERVSLSEIDYPAVLSNIEEEELKDNLERNDCFWGKDILSLSYEFMWDCILDDSPYRKSSLIELRTITNLASMTVYILHEMKVMDDEAYAQFVAYIANAWRSGIKL